MSKSFKMMKMKRKMTLRQLMTQMKTLTLMMTLTKLAKQGGPKNELARLRKSILLKTRFASTFKKLVVFAYSELMKKLSLPEKSPIS